MKTLIHYLFLLNTVFVASGWAELFSLRPPYVVDSIPAPRRTGHISICFDSSGSLRVLLTSVYTLRDSLIVRIDPADGRILDTLVIQSLSGDKLAGMAFAYDKFWLTAWGPGDCTYVYKIDTLGHLLTRFLAPIVPPARGNGISFEGDKLWLTSTYDAQMISGVFQTDTLGNALRFVRISNSNDTIGTPGFNAFWKRSPGTLFVSTWDRLCQIKTSDSVASLIMAWPSPFDPSYPTIRGSSFDTSGFFWANNLDYRWILKLDLGLTGVESVKSSVPKFPRQVRVLSPEPSPMSSACLINFEIPRTSRVQLSLMNIAGSRVRLLNDGIVRAGEYRVIWDGRDDHGRRVPSGVYFLKLEALGQSAVQKVVVVR